MALSSLCILLSFFPTQMTTPVRGPPSFSGTLQTKLCDSKCFRNYKCHQYDKYKKSEIKPPMSSMQTGILYFYVFQFTSFSTVLVSWGLAEMACISESLFRVLLARATFRFLLMTSVSGVSTLSPGLDLPPGVSNAPSASLRKEQPMKYLHNLLLQAYNIKQKL